MQLCKCLGPDAQTELADQTIADDPARIADAQISIMGFISHVGLHRQPIIDHFFAPEDFNSGGEKLHWSFRTDEVPHI